MTQQRGSTASIKIGFESTYGTASDTGFVLPVNTCDVVGSKTRNSPATLTGTRNPVVPFTGNQDVAGNIVLPADSLALAYWLHAMFSTAVTTGSSPYVHEFKIGNNMPSFTLEKGFTDLATDVYERFVGCKVSTFGLTVGGDGELVCNLAVLGAGQSEQTSPFDAAPTSITIARLENFNAALTEGGVSLANATEVTLNFNFGLDPDQFVIGGGGVRGAIPEGIVTVSGSLTTLFEDKTLLDKAIANTESSLKITITDSASSILELEVQELLYSVNGVPLDGPQGLVVSLDFVGYYTDGSEASAVVARLTNTVASYSLQTVTTTAAPTTAPP